VTTAADAGALLHAVLVFDSPALVRSHLVPDVRRRIEAGELLFAAIGDSARAILEQHLDLSGVRWCDPAIFERRLGAMFTHLDRLVAAERSGRPIHVLAEPRLDLAGAPADATRVHAYLAYERAGNEAFAGRGVSVTCLWDATRYRHQVLDQADAAHSHILTPDGARRRQPREVEAAEHGTQRRARPPGDADFDLLVADAGDLMSVRGRLRAWSDAYGFSRDDAEDIALAVAEVAANGLRHGLPPVRVRGWQQQPRTLVIHIDDQGDGPIPVTAGYRRPPDAPGGRGLWLARQLADVVTIDGSAVRLYFPYAAMNRDERPATS
jgi:anti-sigma regulatory factor (Ser/Thr protein kinase)